MRKRGRAGNVDANPIRRIPCRSTISPHSLQHGTKIFPAALRREAEIRLVEARLARISKAIGEEGPDPIVFDHGDGGQVGTEGAVSGIAELVPAVCYQFLGGGGAVFVAVDEVGVVVCYYGDGGGDVGGVGCCFVARAGLGLGACEEQGSEEEGWDHLGLDLSTLEVCEWYSGTEKQDW